MDGREVDGWFGFHQSPRELHHPTPFGGTPPRNEEGRTEPISQVGGKGGDLIAFPIRHHKGGYEADVFSPPFTRRRGPKGRGGLDLNG